MHNVNLVSQRACQHMRLVNQNLKEKISKSIQSRYTFSIADLLFSIVARH